MGRHSVVENEQHEEIPPTPIPNELPSPAPGVDGLGRGIRSVVDGGWG